MKKSIKLILIVIVILIVGIILFFLANNDNINNINSITKKNTKNTKNLNNLTIPENNSETIDEDEISKLLKDQQLRTCGSNGIPPCKDGGTLTNIPDPQYVISNYNSAFSETINGEVGAAMVACCTYEYNPTISDSTIIDAIVIAGLASLMDTMMNITDLVQMSFDAVEPLLGNHTKVMNTNNVKAARTNINNNIEKIKNTGTKEINKSIGTQNNKFDGKIKQSSQIKMEVEHFNKGVKLTHDKIDIRTQQTKSFTNVRSNRVNQMNLGKEAIEGTKNGPQILEKKGLGIGGRSSAGTLGRNAADIAVRDTIDDTVKTGVRVASKDTAQLAAKSAGRLAANTSTRIASGLGSGLIRGAIASLFEPLAIIMGIIDLIMAFMPTYTSETYELPNDTASLQDLIKFRDGEIIAFNKSKINAGLPLPRISGPLDHLPIYPTGDLDIYNPKSIQEIYQLLQTEYCVSFISRALEEIKNFDTFSPADRIAIVDKLSIFAMKYFDTPAGETYLDQRSCLFVKGLNINGMCSWPNKEKCESSYNWEKIAKQLKNPDSYQNDTQNDIDVTYVEWRPAYKVDPATGKDIITGIEPPSACIQVNPNIKYECSVTPGLEYKQHIQACSYKKSYCCERGMSYLPNEQGKEIGTCYAGYVTENCVNYGAYGSQRSCNTIHSPIVGCN